MLGLYINRACLINGRGAVCSMGRQSPAGEMQPDVLLILGICFFFSFVVNLINIGLEGRDMWDLRMEGSEGGTVRNTEEGKGERSSCRDPVNREQSYIHTENKETLNTQWCLELRCM